MSRIPLVIALLLGMGLGGGAVYLLQSRFPMDEARVRGVVSEMLAAHDEQAPVMINTPPMDVATLGRMIDNYLMSNPKLLQRMSDALDIEVRAEKVAATREAIGKYRGAIFNEPGQIVVGNPDGDVTLVEMFDYNCSYCRGALPDLVQLMAEDPNLRVVLKEFPILSQQSVDAARVAVLVAEQPVDYWAFHQKLFTSRGQVTLDTALAAAKDLGLNPVTLQLDMQSAAVTSVIEKSYDIAKALNITGTPTYIIGDEMIPGAVPIEQIKTRIANMRACGKTVCASSGWFKLLSSMRSNPAA
jgi:protein-disulfide isomerase